MKLKEIATGLSEILDHIQFWGEDFCGLGLTHEAVLRAAIKSIESTRWRKLEEEQPPDEEKWYEIWETGYWSPDLSLNKGLWRLIPKTNTWGFSVSRVEWWRPITPPEES